MLTLPVRFITSHGPKDSLEPGELSFLGSESDYPSAERRMQSLAETLAAELSGHELFIYRMSRPQNGLFLWRQSHGSKGEERGTEPAGAMLIGYDIYAAPKGLADSPSTSSNVSKLTEGILAICANYGQHGAPGSGGP